MVDSLTLLHAVRIRWQTWEKVALRMRPVFVKDFSPRPVFVKDFSPRPVFVKDFSPRPVFVKDFSPLVIQASHWTRISTLN